MWLMTQYFFEGFEILGALLGTDESMDAIQRVQGADRQVQIEKCHPQTLIFNF